MKLSLLSRPGLAICLLAGAGTAWGWDYAGHRLVNQLALASLPTNFPAFVFTAAAKERIAFLGGEPDRWRNTPDLPLRHGNGPDHFLDIEDLEPAGLEPRALSPLRYDFLLQLGAARALKPGNFPPIDAEKDQDRTKALPGFLPWRITEDYAKLKSAFSYLKTLAEAGTAEEVANAQQNVIYLMGVMGHFVGDATQPLHTTRHYNGWVGPNPKNYPTNRTFHAWIDGGYLEKVGIKTEPLFAAVRPARSVTAGAAPGAHTNLFPVVMDFLLEQFRLVEPLYQLERDGKLAGRGQFTQEGYEFITRQLVKAGQMLGDLWLTAWLDAPPDTYLKAALAKRKLAQEKGNASPP
jgi:hypothetical protein